VAQWLKNWLMCLCSKVRIQVPLVSGRK
jgi:hypothetical protein